MAYKAKLSVGGKDYDVISCNYFFNQGTGPDGRTNSDVRGGQIALTMLSSEDTALVEWMVDPHKTLDGKITFFQLDSDQKLKEIKFTKAYCVSHSESFSNSGNMTESILMSAKKLEIGNAVHENPWSGN